MSRYLASPALLAALRSSLGGGFLGDPQVSLVGFQYEAKMVIHDDWMNGGTPISGNLYIHILYIYNIYVRVYGLHRYIYIYIQ